MVLGLCSDIMSELLKCYVNLAAASFAAEKGDFVFKFHSNVFHPFRFYCQNITNFFFSRDGRDSNGPIKCIFQDRQ